MFKNIRNINKKIINIIGITNIKCSISDNMYILRNYMKTENLTTDIHIIDVNDIHKKNIYKLIANNIKDNIFCIQPWDIAHNPYILEVLDRLYNINKKPSIIWVWEFKSLPQIFKYYERYFKIIYVQSQFCYEVFSSNLSVTVIKLPLTSRIYEYFDKISTHKIIDEATTTILNETTGKIRLGYCFDANSSLVRKNVLQLTNAFTITKNDNIVLILKCRGPRYNNFVNNIEKKLYSTLLSNVSNSKNIYLINNELPSLDLYKLYTYFDYYITPHCSEGFGITIYDNMILGNKIISPYYSGEKTYLERNEIIELKYEEKILNDLKTHPIYGKMDKLYGAYVSVETILNIINNL